MCAHYDDDEIFCEFSCSNRRINLLVFRVMGGSSSVDVQMPFRACVCKDSCDLFTDPICRYFGSTASLTVATCSFECFRQSTGIPMPPVDCHVVAA